MLRYMGRIRLLLVATFATISLGCATWEDYRDANGAGRANAEVAIFKAHLDNTYRIVSASDGRLEYQYDPAQTRALGFAAHPRVRLLPGRYTITVKMWPFGSLHEFAVDLEAGHIYKVETYLCSFECISAGKPNRHDMWIQDLTTRKRISDVASECYLGKKRQRERRKVPCPAEEDARETHSVNQEDPEAEKREEDARDGGGEGKANAEVAIFKAHPDNIRRVVRASDGHMEYQYDQEVKRTKRSGPDILIRLLPAQYTITIKTWPFGSLYEFQVDLKAGHTYQVQTDLCAFECISTGEPYRHERWIQDLTTGERISDISSECYLGKKRRRERQKVPCPDD